MGKLVGVGRTWAEWWAGDPAAPSSLPKELEGARCYDAELNEIIARRCRAGDCPSGDDMADLLELDYCDDYWNRQMADSGFVPLGSAALVAGIALVGGYLLGGELARRRNG